LKASRGRAVNITGFSAYDAELAAKWAQLIKEVAPGVTRVAVIFNPDTAPQARLLNPAIATAAASLGMTATFAPVQDDAGVESAIAAVAREPGGGVITLPDFSMHCIAMRSLRRPPATTCRCLAWMSSSPGRVP
jgi:putative ABC transport system substrate-binding protein